MSIAIIYVNIENVSNNYPHNSSVILTNFVYPCSLEYVFLQIILILFNQRFNSCNPDHYPYT